MTSTGATLEQELDGLGPVDKRVVARLREGADGPDEVAVESAIKTSGTRT